MSQNASFIRKVTYIAAIALLLIPLSWLSQPAAGTGAGGKLARLRQKNGLSQSQLGEIDPASESMKLASLGLKGVAANLLWTKATHAKKVKDYDTLSATVQQIVKLQPNFIKVWEFQAHNLSYNVSAEFDLYTDRYHWVKKGIDFLIEGADRNRKEPRMLTYIGDYTGRKVGRSDENKQYRRLFREDTEFHELMAEYVDIEKATAPGLNGKYDNWLLAYLWYRKSYRLIEEEGIAYRGRAPIVYYSDAPLAKMSFADFFVKEFDPGEREVVKENWRSAQLDWVEFGERQIRSTFGFYLRLDGLSAAQAKYDKLKGDFDARTIEIRKKVKAKKLAALPDDVEPLFDKQFADLHADDKRIYRRHENATRVSDREVADAAPADLQRELRDMVDAVADAYGVLRNIEAYRGNVNFDYWLARCNAESDDDASWARKHMYDAHNAFLEARMESSEVRAEDGQTIRVDGAKEGYEKAWDRWATVFEDYPILVQKPFAEALAPYIVEYRNVLAELGQDELPTDFKLMGILDLRAGEDGLPDSKMLSERAAKQKQLEESEQKEGDKADKSDDTKKGDTKKGDTEKKADDPKGGDSKATEKKPQNGKDKNTDSNSKTDAANPDKVKKPKSSKSDAAKKSGKSEG